MAHKKQKKHHVSHPHKSAHNVQVTHVTPHHTIAAKPTPVVHHLVTSPTKQVTHVQSKPVAPKPTQPAKPSSSYKPAAPRLKGPSSYRSTGGEHPGYGGTQFSVSEAKLALPQYTKPQAQQPVKHLFPEMGAEIQKQASNVGNGWTRAWNTISSWFGG